ncbi:MAG: ATP-binding protein [Anaerolineae bacterium]
MNELLQIERSKITNRIRLQNARYTLGRGEENDLVFDSRKVSRLHATLVQEDDSYVIEDNNSTNHVFVNGEQVQRKKLTSGDRVSLSREVNFIFIAGETDGDPATAAPDSLPQHWEVIKQNDFLRLKEVTHRITSLDSLDNILKLVLTEVIELVGAERGFIALANAQGELELGTGVSYSLPFNKKMKSKGKLPFSQSIVRRVMKTHKSVFVLNIEDRKDLLSQSIVDLHLMSIMCVPLMFDGRLSGVLYVDSGQQLTDFSQTDRLFFTILADYAAIAIQNAKRFDRVNTANRHLEEEMAESEERYRRLVEFSPDAVLVHAEGKFVFANPAAVTLLGAAGPDELVGKPALSIVHPGHRPIVEARIQRVLQEGVPAPPREETFLRFDGQTVEVEVSATSLPYQGRQAVQVTARDITGRKQMEQELLRVQKLESVGVLAGGIAHDFNNILQSIIGNALLAKMDANRPAKVIRYLSEVENAVSRATRLTSQLLTFSRGGSPVTRAAPIEQLIEETAVFALHGSRVAHKFEFEPGLPLVEVDSDQINHVVHNLVINAAQAMPMGGTVTISAAQVETDEEQVTRFLRAGRYVKITVADEGIGIPAKILDKIFDPYFTTKHEGNGLGLALCHSIVTSHGGVIKAKSVEGQGATFTFYLPVSQQAPPPPPEPVQSVTDLRGKVLVMDDDEVVREVVTQILERFGCTVTAVADGAAAIEAYTRAADTDTPFDIVMFDLTVPGGMGGKEAIEKLLALDPDVKAIVASGYSNDPVMSNPEQYGFKQVIAKPFDLEEVGLAVKSLLNGNNH